jgi:hypothetical protein
MVLYLWRNVVGNSAIGVYMDISGIFSLLAAYFN